MSLDSGVKSYIKCEATVTVFFPVDSNGKEYCTCRHCKFYRDMSNRCSLTQDVVDFPEKYVGSTCPLKIITDENGEIA